VNPIKSIKFQEVPNSYTVGENSTLKVLLDISYMNNQTFLGNKDVSFFVYPFVDNKILDTIRNNQILPIDIILK
jgi:hypothetical protein